MAGIPNPTIQRRRLGNALRRAREQAKLTQDEVASRIDAAPSKVSRTEQGQSGLRLTDLNALLDLYGVPEAERQPMRELAKAGRQRGRWSSYRNVIPNWFATFVDLEADATEIMQYQPEIIPGILQTEAYIRTLSNTAYPRWTASQVEDAVQVRQERQSILDSSTAPELSFILSESALRRRVGSAEIMADQRRHLITLAERPNVDIQVLPFEATYETASFAFVTLRFEHDPTTDTIYLETYGDADYLDGEQDVLRYARLWDRLRAAALGPIESIEMINRMGDTGN